MYSIWWMLLAFVAGGYAGAIAVALMTMSARQDRAAARTAMAPKERGAWRRGHMGHREHFNHS